MRKGILELGFIILMVICIHAERLLHKGSITGRVSPARDASSIIAVRGNDSVKVVSNDGHFGMELQPGNWKLIFATNKYGVLPTERRVRVLEGQHIILGEIRLSR
ncbi:MAG TPA: hypothetical protein DIC22_02450 [Chitinophagaceae bacterium]|nr:hypothetical protein [Chitinophagaceae bacterium]